MEQRVVAQVIFLGLISILYLTLVGCGSTDTAMMDTGKSSVKLGGHHLDNTIVTVLASAKVGGPTGSAINRQMDRQASELKSKLKGARVMRFEEGILITIDTRDLFEEDSYGLESTSMVKDLAKILDKYSFTNAVIEGHTDNVGEEIYNKSLSENRAHEIENYLIARGIKDARIKTRGYGEKQPIASNDTESGRQLNRRIEIAIFANEELRLAAASEVATYTALKQ